MATWALPFYKREQKLPQGIGTTNICSVCTLFTSVTLSIWAWIFTAVCTKIHAWRVANTPSQMLPRTYTVLGTWGYCKEPSYHFGGLHKGQADLQFL